MSNNKFSGSIYEFPRASLFAPAPETERERSSLQWSILNGNPRISVWTRVPSDSAFRGPIAAGFGVTSMEMLLNAMEQIYSGPNNKREAYTVEGFPENSDGEKVNGPRQKIIKSTVKYGKDENGICWIAVEDNINDRPKLVFKFVDEFFHHFRIEGQEISESEASQRQAVGIVRYLRTRFAQHDRGVTPEEKKAFSDSRKQGRPANNFNADRPSKRADNFGDDDIPF